MEKTKLPSETLRENEVDTWRKGIPRTVYEKWKSLHMYEKANYYISRVGDSWFVVAEEDDIVFELKIPTPKFSKGDPLFRLYVHKSGTLIESVVISSIEVREDEVWYWFDDTEEDVTTPHCAPEASFFRTYSDAVEGFQKVLYTPQVKKIVELLDKTIDRQESSDKADTEHPPRYSTSVSTLKWIKRRILTDASLTE